MVNVVDTLVVLGLATVSLGTIQEADGVKERTFWLRNVGTEAVVLKQGYTSCGCTTINFAKDKPIPPGDSASVTLRFNPTGKSGEFEEVGTVTYTPAAQKSKSATQNSPAAKSSKPKHVNLTLEGTCVSSEESLLRQFPIRINDDLRLSTDRFDLGIMHVGETKERGVIILHRNEKPRAGQHTLHTSDRQERITVSFSPDTNTPKGIKHIKRQITTLHKGKKITLDITLDVMIK